MAIRVRRTIPIFLACAAAVTTVTAVAVMPTAHAATPQSYSGSTSDGGTWIADTPASWNGTVLLYSHGFGPVVAQDAPDPGTKAELLKLGYALVGASYGPPTANWWALGSALTDQFQALSAFRADLPSKPAHVIAVGTSMGGLISALEDQNANGRINASLTTCGMVDGAGVLSEYQLEGEYAISKLLDPAANLGLVNFPGDATGQGPTQGLQLGQEMDSVAQTAQQSAAGRARLALAMAFLNVPAWAAGDQQPAVNDYVGQEQQQYQVEFGNTAFTVPMFTEDGRGWIEEAAGGNMSWTADIDYARELAKSPYYAEVAALYKQAGLSLGADLGSLTSGADITADPSAVKWIEETSTLSGRLQVPELDLHTISDQRPVETVNV